MTGLDLDPAMIQRARANAQRGGDRDERTPWFLVGDVASMAFPDRSFDLVVSTLSMHHWADPTAGLAEIGRVLRPGARALVWDLRPGVRPHPFGPRHVHMPDPVEHTPSSPLTVLSVAPWPWPWRFNLTQRIELAARQVTLVESTLACVGGHSGGRPPVRTQVTGSKATTTRKLRRDSR